MRNLFLKFSIYCHVINMVKNLFAFTGLKIEKRYVVLADIYKTQLRT